MAYICPMQVLTLVCCGLHLHLNCVQNSRCSELGADYFGRYVPVSEARAILNWLLAAECMPNL